MHLYKRKDSKFWWYKFEMDGVAYRASTGVKNRRDAEGIASKARLKAIEGKYDIKRQKETPLFKDAMEQFLKHIEDQHADHPRTAKRYRSSAVSLIKTFGAKKLHLIRADDVERYKNDRMAGNGKKKLKPATVNADLGTMRTMYNYFVSLEVVTKTPVSRIKLLPMNNEKTRVLSFEEERLYLAACAQPLHDIAVLILETGMRPDEICRMRRENVNLAEGWVFNPYGKSKAARRKLSLTRRAADVLTRRIREGNSEYLFPLDDDPSQPIAYTHYLHEVALKNSEIAHCRLYDCRHTFATRMVEAGVDLVTLAGLLGHSKIQMVLRYAHPTEEHKVQAMRKLEEFMMQKQMAEAVTSAMIN
jgi:integrase